ncbi:hypothetical protein Moror_1194 [Moniliophthora roreri MCA 2997]|uniref:F-box domain-containing protein n=1 Tax=Moniliophthora roreri (strain MCA 2997) TaxID=1381753 RepID=V2YCW9_MONRO|nr:hypothetical protein Moror_1194 [Moniliophthora roreri MCA 2997]
MSLIPERLFKSLFTFRLKQTKATSYRRRKNSKSSHYRLPLEITREVMSYRDSYHDLCNFSLVSRTWRQAALPLLFHRIEIAHEDDMRHCQQLLNSSQDITNCVRFFIVNPHMCKPFNPASTLLSLPSMPGVVEFAWWAPSEYPITTQTVISHFMHSFPNLLRVSVFGAFIDARALVCFLKQVCGPTVRELMLHAVQFIWNSPESELDVPRLDLSALESFEVDGSESYSDFILNSVIAPQSLTVTLYSFWPDSPYLLFAKVAATITQLNLIINPGPNTYGRLLVPMPTTLQSFPVLEKFALNFAAIRLGEEYHPATVLYWAQAFFPLFDAPGLTSLELCFVMAASLEMLKVIKFYDWKTFCALLLEHYPKIQELIICVRPSTEFGRSKRMMLENEVKKHIPASSFGGRRITVIWGEFL